MSSSKSKFVVTLLLMMSLLIACSDQKSDGSAKNKVVPAKELTAEENVAKWKKEAETGNAEYQLKLGNAYSDGKGVPKDAAQAVAWWRKAAEQGNATAQRRLGASYLAWYLDGEVIPKDPTRNPFLLSEEDTKLGVEWLRKAAEKGDVEAQYILGSYFDDAGLEILINQADAPIRTAESIKWYRKAAEQGNADAQNALGSAYDDGKGVPKDAVQAVLWFRKAAEQGKAHAQSWLAWGYYSGEGVPRDVIQAYMWANLAAAQGYELGAMLRDFELPKVMTPAQIAEAQRLTREWKPGQHTESATTSNSPSNGALEKALVGTAFLSASRGIS